MDNTTKDPEFNAQCEDSITTSQKSITKIAEEAGVGLVVQNRRLYSKKQSGQFTKNLNKQSQRCKGTKMSTNSSPTKNTFSTSKQIMTLNNIKDVLMHFGIPWKSTLTNIPSKKDREQYGKMQHLQICSPGKSPPACISAST